MAKGPYTITPLKPAGIHYVRAGAPETVSDWRGALAAARAAYKRTGAVPDVIDSAGHDALSYEDVGLWGLE